MFDMEINSYDIKRAKSLQKAIFIVLLFSVCVLGISLRMCNLTNVTSRSPDEMVYTYQAGTIALYGTEGIKFLVRQYNMTEDTWQYPPPIRLGYLWPLAATMKTINLMDVRAGVYISSFFSIVSLLLLILLGLRFFNKWITMYALLFMSVSPMALAIARRTWQDAMLGCIGLLLIYFCCELTRNTNRIIRYIFFIIVGSYCMLIKSSGVLIYALCIFWLLWILLVNEKSFLKSTLLLTFSALGAVISIVFLLQATGGVSAVKEVLMHMGKAVQGSVYARQYCSGHWYRFFEMLWMLTPLNTILCFIGIIGACLPDDIYQKGPIVPINENRNVIFGIIFFMIAFMAVLFLAKKYPLNLRYVSVLYVTFYLISGLGLWYIILFLKKVFKNISTPTVITCIVAMILVTAINDYQNFKRVIVKSGIKDLSIRLLKESSR